MNDFTRVLQLDATRANPTDRTIPVVVSTETPVDRGSYIEILSHTPDSVDLSRAPLPLIEGHDAKKTNIGIIEGLTVIDRKLRGIARFGTSARATELFNDVVSKIVSGLSLGYRINDYVEDGNVLTATNFTPFEVSVTGIPADINSGFYRNKKMNISKAEVDEETRNEILEIRAEAIREMRREWDERSGIRRPQVVKERVYDADAAYREWQCTMQDAMKLRYGIAIKNPHPFAEALSDRSLQQWANCLKRGLTTSDFGDTMALAYGAVVSKWLPVNIANNLVADQIAMNYKPQMIVALDVEPAVEAFEDTETKFTQLTANAEPGKLREFTLNLLFSRKVLINDDRNIIEESLRQAVQLLQRQDEVLVCETLAANATLKSGKALFDTDTSVSGLGHVAGALDSAISKLLNFSTAGGPSGLPPSALFVSPDISGIYARALYQMPALGIQLVTSSYLPTATAYLFCDPKQRAGLVRLRLRNTTGPYVSKGGSPEGYSGWGVAAHYSVAVTPSYRGSIIKITS
jgi:phage head maturation protease